jgi:predicted O-methyltransferase YrrM
VGRVLKNREALAAHFADLGFWVGAEIGVCHGNYSRVLLTAMPTLCLYGVDPYRRKPSDRQIADERLAPWISSQRFLFMQLSSLRAVQSFANGSLDFVFIDACHTHPAVDQDIAAWAPKVRSGGIVSGHDYFVGGRDVIEAVDTYVAAHPCLSLQLTAHDRANPDNDCRQPSWWWVQP